MKVRRWALIAAAGLLAAGAVGGLYVAQRIQIGEQEDGTFLVPTGQRLTPAGTLIRIEGSRPKDMALSPDGNHIAVLGHRFLSIHDASGKTLATLPWAPGPLGITWSPDNTTFFAAEAQGKVGIFTWDGETISPTGTIALEDQRLTAADRRAQGANPQVAALAVSPDGNTLYAALGIRNAIAVVSLNDLEQRDTVRTGAAPYHIALSPDGRTLAVANRGGRLRLDPDDPRAKTAGTEVRIDPETDAAWRGSVTLIDTRSLRRRETAVGRQPAGLCFSPDGKTLYVAESDSDSVTFMDPVDGRIIGNLSMRPPEEPEFGQIPTCVTASADGNRLYVACGGINAVAVVDLGAEPKIAGYIPTAWFPVTVLEGREHIFVASTKGIGARPAEIAAFNVHQSVGAIQAIARRDLRSLKPHTDKVALNNHWFESPAARAGRPPAPLPERLGEPSLFKHVVYIIKENVTYDSVLGDMPEGRGDPSLCTFPEFVTPNHHTLARQFVLLDNFYTSGTNSADGHQWTSSGIANAYVEQNYTSNARSYPFDGGDALANSPEGFLWTAAANAGKSVRIFGEFVNRPQVVYTPTGRRPTWTEAWKDYRDKTGFIQTRAETDNAALRPFLNPKYIGFPTTITDQWRADVFLEEFREWEAKGEMPNLVMMLLPNDHTVGTVEGFPTPRATVADNDLALGRIVEAISNSQFWKETLILVVQDDSQLGVDHVDGHRSVAFAISPYAKRGEVISEMYDHTSFLRTIGLVLGIPPMNRFDRAGKPLRECFTRVLDMTPYTALPNNVPLDEMNPPVRTLTGEARRLAELCATLDWSDIDRADPETVTRAIWLASKPGVPFPAHLYKPPMDVDDE